jgi:hypothetical protein
MHAEREEGPNLSGREAPLRQGAPLPQTVLLHESLKPPFALRCPHCAGQIIIDYAGTVASNPGMPSGAIAAAKETIDPSEQGKEAPSFVSSHGTMRTSTIEETESRVSEHKVPADPFGWKRGAMKKTT